MRRAIWNSGFGMGAVLALASGLAAAASVREPEPCDIGPAFILPGGFGGTGPIHRRGRFKRNQRLQRKRGARK